MEMQELLKIVDTQLMHSTLYTILVAVATIFIFTFGKKFLSFYQVRKNLRNEWKGPKCHWFWGHLGMVTKGNKDPARFITYFTEKEKEFPNGLTLYPGPLGAVLMLYNPNIVKKVMSASAWEVPKGKGTFWAFKQWIDGGLVFLDGNDWFRHRRLLTSAFHFEILKHYSNIMNSCSNTLIEKWNNEIGKKDSARIEVFNQFSLMTLDVILQCLVGYKSNCQSEKDLNPYPVAIRNLARLVIERERNKNLLMRFQFFYNRSSSGRQFQRDCDTVKSFAHFFIQERRNKYAASNSESTTKNNLDFLDMLLQAKDDDGSGLRDDEMVAEINTFLFAGHDTTSSALSWTLYCLASYPEHQQKCVDEIFKVMGNRQDVSWSDLSSFPYLTRCIKESLRIYPPVPAVLRRVEKDIHAEGKTILKGTLVNLSIIGVHRSEMFWKDPQKYNPDRFSIENASKQNNHAFIPFSAGPRNCIGQHLSMNETKITLAKLLRKFTFSVDTNHKIVHCQEIVYKAKGGLYLFVEPRK